MTQTRFLLTIPALLATVAIPAYAATDSPLKINSEIRSQYLYEDNRDLGADTLNPSDNGSVDLRLKLNYRPSDVFSSYLELSAFHNWGDASGEDETGQSSGSGRYLELRQAWVKFSELFGVLPLSAQLGRQRISEPYAFMWNQNIDAVRLDYTTTILSGFIIGAAENMASYRTSHDNFEGSDKDILHLLTEINFQMDADNYIQLRGLHVHDHSGKFGIGDVVSEGERDDEDQDLSWGNLRVAGETKEGYGIISGLSYRLDGAVVVGDISTTSSTSIVGSTSRTITGETSRNVMGYAFDGGLDMTMAGLPLSPTLMLGYAYGSGDDGSGTDTSFHQSDLAGNSSRQGISGATSHNYGEVLRPDLSNLHIMKAGVGFPVLSSSDLSFIYRNYWLANDATGLRDAHVGIATSGTDAYVGQEIDIIYNMSVDEEFPSVTLMPNTNFKVSVGAFRAGDAFGTSADENFFRGKADLIFKF